ncbi:MAG: peptide deformylase [Candidatus Omnitrophica bacterium]|nr:peptide deformylase [Candidatus Omnitrophota bacterium]MBI5143539.1 peptide deformylase [Candidatus Omnitrophota bacterium]
MKLDIKKFPNKILRKKASRLEKVSDSDRAMLRDMAETMYLNKGVGLAAVQVGIDKQLAVIDVGKGLVKVVNPVILTKEGKVIEEEGCLSVPDTTVMVKRSERITVGFLNENGDVSQITAEGLFARAIQHEIDHLYGRLIIDYMSPVKKLFFLTKYR